MKSRCFHACGSLELLLPVVALHSNNNVKNGNDNCDNSHHNHNMFSAETCSPGYASEIIVEV
jgi:hypothetical protein